mgnify:CR=1 FL=1
MIYYPIYYNRFPLMQAYYLKFSKNNLENSGFGIIRYVEEEVTLLLLSLFSTRYNDSLSLLSIWNSRYVGDDSVEEGVTLLLISLVSTRFNGSMSLLSLWNN